MVVRIDVITVLYGGGPVRGQPNRMNASFFRKACTHPGHEMVALPSFVSTRFIGFHLSVRGKQRTGKKGAGLCSHTP